MANTQLKEQWERDGFLHLKGVLDPKRLNTVRLKVQASVNQFLYELKEDGKIEDVGADASFDRRLYQAGGEHAQKLGRLGFDRPSFATKALYDLHNDPGLIEALEVFLGTNIVATNAYNIRPKLPHQDSTNTPWHQDAGYYGKEAEGCNLWTCWVPFVPVDHEMGCMQVIRGSHKWPYLKHFKGANAGNFLEVDPFEYKPEDCVTIEMKPTDILLFNHLAMHRSTPNLSEKIRWSIDMRFGASGDYQGPSTQLRWTSDLKEWLVGQNAMPYQKWQELADLHYGKTQNA